MKEERFTCPCCGYKTLEENPPGTYNICPVCFWEDDGVQFDDPDYEGGANWVSLREAQRSYVEKDACEERLYAFVEKPEGKYQKDASWKPLPQPTREDLLKKSKPDFIVGDDGIVKHA